MLYRLVHFSQAQRFDCILLALRAIYNAFYLSYSYFFHHHLYFTFVKKADLKSYGGLAVKNLLYIYFALASNGPRITKL